MVKAPSETVHDLIRECSEEWREGADFPTIWRDTLMQHPLIAGPPVQGYANNEPVLRVPLVGGRWLAFGSKGFSLN